MLEIRRKIRDFYHLLPIPIQGLLFSAYANGYRIKRKMIPPYPNEKNNNYTVRFPRIDSIGKLIKYVEKKGSVISGKEIIENYSAEKQTILIVSHELTMTGAPIVQLFLAETLVRLGFQVMIISPVDGALFREESVKRGVPVIYYADLFMSDLIYKSRELFYKVVAGTIISYPVIRMLGRTDTEVIWWIHEGIGIYREYIARVVPRKLPDNIKVYCGGEYAEKMLKSRFPGYNISQFLFYSPDLRKVLKSDSELYNRIDENKKVFALFGVISRRKGQDVLARAIDYLSDEVRRESLFVFVGRKVDEVNEKKIAEKVDAVREKYPDNVIWCDEVDISQLYKLYEKIDFMVCASRDDPLPGVVANAMSMNIPAICSANTGTAPILRKYKAGFVYSHNSPTELSRLIEKAYHMDPEEYISMGRQARKAFEIVHCEDEFYKNVKDIFC